MARDLIPPPSPAGRPPPDPVLEPRSEPAEAQAEPASGPVARIPAPFRGRFGFVFGALAGIAVCAAALAVLLVSSPGGSSEVSLAENWSDWKPETTETLAAAQAIAAHVGAQYLRDDGDQLVAVQAGPIAVQGLPAGVAVKPQGGTIEVLDGEGLLYVLNGLGPEGALPGKPSEARGSLLRREALELALYTFRYLEDVTMVAVLMPAPQQPKPKKNGDAAQAATETPPRQAVFFRPGDVLPQLQAPLNRTLPSKPPRPNALTPQEATRIDSLTLRNVFLSEWQRAQNGVPFLVLQEPESIE